MASIRFEQANAPEVFDEIETLARHIWTAHYTPIIGPEQVAYMLEKFQSKQAMLAQIGEGYQYYTLRYEEELAGYLSIQPRGEVLFLSKIYLHAHFRGKGLGRKGLDFVEETARKWGKKSIKLTVNKHNTESIAAYEKCGFRKVESVVMDIGGGFVMDDFVMEKNLNTPQ